MADKMEIVKTPCVIYVRSTSKNITVKWCRRTQQGARSLQRPCLFDTDTADSTRQRIEQKIKRGDTAICVRIPKLTVPTPIADLGV